MLWAACNVAFFGFLIIGEMTVSNQAAFNESVHFSLGNVTVDSRHSPTTTWVKLSSPKLTPGIKLCLARTESTICPIKAILQHLAIGEACRDPYLFFLMVLTRSRFKSLLSATLKQSGLDDMRYNTHSFHVGTPTSAKTTEISDTHIQILGRWKSSAYRSYIKTPTPVLQQLSKQLVLASQFPMEECPGHSS